VSGIVCSLFTPLVMVWEYAAMVRRRRQFPFPVGSLRKQVQAVFQDRRETRIYLRGLMRGYFEPGVVMLPANPRDLANWVGHRDGCELREGRIELTELPSRRDSWR
jgi:hypothetical protein